MSHQISTKKSYITISGENRYATEATTAINKLRKRHQMRSFIKRGDGKSIGNGMSADCVGRIKNVKF
jgi:hypothetical protein